MNDADLNIKTGEPSELDKITKDVVSRPLDKDEMSGFGRTGPKAPGVCPYFDIQIPSRSERRKKAEIVVGVRGTF